MMTPPPAGKYRIENCVWRHISGRTHLYFDLTSMEGEHCSAMWPFVVGVTPGKHSIEPGDIFVVSRLGELSIEHTLPRPAKPQRVIGETIKVSEETRAKRREQKKRRDDIRQLRDEGLTLAAIGKMYGISGQAVRQTLIRQAKPDAW
jgi:hypothetical protein